MSSFTAPLVLEALGSERSVMVECVRLYARFA